LRSPLKSQKNLVYNHSKLLDFFNLKPYIFINSGGKS
jgi:hypothetical protein